MKLGSYDVHPAAELFPLLEGPGFDALVEDIRARGLQEPIVVHNGVLLDGRNRLRACEAAGVTPMQRGWEGDEANVVPWIVGANLHRRHLSESQRAMVAARLATLLPGRPGKGSIDPITQGSAAGLLNVSAPSVKRARVVVDEGADEVVAAVDRGDVAVSTAADFVRAVPDKDEQVEILRRDDTAGILAAAKAIREERAAANRRMTESIKANRPAPPVGLYRAIVIDPPWPLTVIERDNRPAQAGLTYPTMTEEELMAMTLPAAEQCHLYLWTTHKLLPLALRLAEKWGFQYQCLMTWSKNVGFTPFSWMYSTEHALFCTRGGLRVEEMGLRLDFRADRREHSRKPDEFYDLVRRASPGPRIDMFSRESREGFDTWGAEANHFESVAK